jgi:hypothetical protein
MALGIFQDEDKDGETDRKGWQTWLNDMSQAALNKFKKWRKIESREEYHARIKREEEEKERKMRELARDMTRPE